MTAEQRAEVIRWLSRQASWRIDQEPDPSIRDDALRLRAELLRRGEEERDRFSVAVRAGRIYGIVQPDANGIARVA